MTSNYYPHPDGADLVPIPGHAAFMQHHNGSTLIWREDWSDENQTAPIGVIPGCVGTSGAGAWLTGRAVGHEVGFRDGRRQGFRECQAGLRALLGAASAADVNTLLHAAADAGRGDVP